MALFPSFSTLFVIFWSACFIPSQRTRVHTLESCGTALSGRKGNMMLNNFVCTSYSFIAKNRIPKCHNHKLKRLDIIASQT